MLVCCLYGSAPLGDAFIINLSFKKLKGSKVCFGTVKSHFSDSVALYFILLTYTVYFNDFRTLCFENDYIQIKF